MNLMASQTSQTAEVVRPFRQALLTHTYQGSAIGDHHRYAEQEPSARHRFERRWEVRLHHVERPVPDIEGTGGLP
jgi:hypothetical protein